MDANSVFLNNYIQKEVYVDHPPNFMKLFLLMFSNWKRLSTIWNKLLKFGLIVWAMFFLKISFWKEGWYNFFSNWAYSSRTCVCQFVATKKSLCKDVSHMLQVKMKGWESFSTILGVKEEEVTWCWRMWSKYVWWWCISMDVIMEPLRRLRW